MWSGGRRGLNNVLIGHTMLDCLADYMGLDPRSIKRLAKINITGSEAFCHGAGEVTPMTISCQIGTEKHRELVRGGV